MFFEDPFLLCSFILIFHLFLVFGFGILVCLILPLLFLLCFDFCYRCLKLEKSTTSIDYGELHAIEA